MRLIGRDLHKNRIDLVIDRADKVANVFEIKYSQAEYLITQKYDLELRNKVEQFKNNISNKKTIWPIFISTYGLANSAYNHFFVKNFTMNILFEEADM